MSTLIANELLKLRTVRWPWILLAAQLILIVAGMSGIVVAGLDLGQPDATRILLTHAGLSSLFTLVLGIMAVAGEYRDGTIANTYLVTPRRSRVIFAKLVAYTGVGTGFGILSAAVALAVAGAWYTVKGATLDPADADVWRTLVGVAAWNGLYAAIGVGLGALVPNLAGAITIALAWIALVEGIVGNLLGDLSRWLPVASGLALENVPDSRLSQLGGGLVLAAYAGVLAGVALMVTVRRDVT
jgi:ABC-2 type transport system permease protein